MEKPTVRLKIEGMHCHHCVRAVKEALEKIKGLVVHRVEIGEAEVSTTEASLPVEEIRHALEEEGYRLVEGESG